MAFVSISKKLCIKDGLCIAICPMMLYRRETKEDFPEPVPNAGEFCIKCGHCQSVCPTTALKLAYSPMELTPIRDELQVHPKKLEQHIKSRRSTRRFKADPVPKEVLESMFGIANYAPSGKNTQPVKWIVYNEAKKVAKLAEFVIDWAKWMLENQTEFAKKEGMHHLVTAWKYEKDLICYNAPCVVITYGDPNDRRALPAGIIAMSHLELALPSRGLGACWGGYLNYVLNHYEPLRKYVGLIQGQQAFGSLLIGYPKHRFLRIPKRNKPVIDWK